MAADDVTSLAPRADAVLFVVRAEHTSARVVRTALEMLYRRQVSVIGVVFNAVRPNQADYYAYTV
jgi:succinoglycan biosynthesis transport protein ExoP